MFNYLFSGLCNNKMDEIELKPDLSNLHNSVELSENKISTPFESCFIKKEIFHIKQEILDEPFDDPLENPNHLENEELKAKLILDNIKIHNENLHCNMCGKIFGMQKTLTEHIKFIHEGKNNHTCKLCGKTFRRPSRLKFHINSVHEGQNANKFKCNQEIMDIPPKNPDISEDLKIKNVGAPIDIEATETCNTAMEYNSHTYTCELCGFEPKTKNKYREKQDHLINKHFKFEFENFIPQSSPFKCPIENCFVVGRDRQEIQRHICKHGVLEKFMKVALKEQGIEENIIDIMVHKGIKKQPTKIQKTHKCEFCDYSSNHSTNLKRHLESVHETKEDNYKIKSEETGKFHKVSSINYVFKNRCLLTDHQGFNTLDFGTLAFGTLDFGLWDSGLRDFGTPGLYNLLINNNIVYG